MCFVFNLWKESMKNSLKAVLISGLLVFGVSVFAHDGDVPASAPTALSTSPVQTGQGDMTYTTVPGWGKVPGQDHIGSTHGGIVVDKQGLVYCSTDGAQGVIVYSEDGKFIKSLGKHTKRFHGMNLNTENGTEYLYAAAMGKVYKLGLDGNVVLTIDGSKQDGHKWRRATAVAVAPNGDIFVADGYGSSAIFKYNSKGEFIKKFGVKGSKEGQLKTSHGLTMDNRNPEKPVLIVCDRENRRLQLFDLEGNFIKVAVTGLRRPCAASIWGDYVVVAELEARAVVLDKDFKVISKLGDNPNKKQWAGFKVKPADWQNGIFTAPHGCAFDAKGNIYVQNWNFVGRITKLVKDKK
jgi:hypothetical protein